MAGIRINGLASGLPANLVDQVIEAERIPVKQMQDKKTHRRGFLGTLIYRLAKMNSNN